MAIIISGTPGVGKTTIARELAGRIGAEYLNLADIVVSRKLYSYYDSRLKSYVVDVEKCKEYLLRVLSCNEILDTHVLDCIPPEKARLVIVLRLNPLVLKERLLQRGYTGIKLRENVEAEVLGATLSDAVGIFGEDTVCEIDTTGRNVEDVLGIILRVIKTGNITGNCKVGLVDWLNDYYWIFEKNDDFWSASSYT